MATNSAEVPRNRALSECPGAILPTEELNAVSVGGVTYPIIACSGYLILGSEGLVGGVRYSSAAANPAEVLCDSTVSDCTGDAIHAEELDTESVGRVASSPGALNATSVCDGAIIPVFSGAGEFNVARSVWMPVGDVGRR